jgi:hypothetical protein
LQLPWHSNLLGKCWYTIILHPRILQQNAKFVTDWLQCTFFILLQVVWNTQEQKINLNPIFVGGSLLK